MGYNMEFINPYITHRIDGLLDQLRSGYSASKSMSSPVKGLERELFISGFLSQVFPSHYRFSSGEVADSRHRNSGQVDIVLEFPFGFSFPIFPSGPRLFLAEGVAAVIEVKSNLVTQWTQVEEKARQVSQLERCYAVQYYEQLLKAMDEGNIKYDDEATANSLALKLMTLQVENQAQPRIPFYVVGFEGWGSRTDPSDKLIPGVIDGIFILDPTMYRAENSSASGYTALVMFLEKLEQDILKNAIRLPTLLNYFTPSIPTTTNT